VISRQFPALEAFRELSARGDVVALGDPIRIAACYETAALEDYRSALLADRGHLPGDAHRAAVLLRSCDELLARATAILTAADGLCAPLATVAAQDHDQERTHSDRITERPGRAYARQGFSLATWSRSVERARAEARGC
jgi:hypothetical protein